MFKRVDDFKDPSAKPELEGFIYRNKEGNDETLIMDYDLVGFANHNGDSVSTFYVDDIPLMIKALQAAYDYKQEELI